MVNEEKPIDIWVRISSEMEITYMNFLFLKLRNIIEIVFVIVFKIKQKLFLLILNMYKYSKFLK